MEDKYVQLCEINMIGQLSSKLKQNPSDLIPFLKMSCAITSLRLKIF
jgi:hypothetical protein